METNKKYFNRLAGGAVLLAGALAFTACSSDEDFVEAAAPGSNVTGETVKTQFSIAVPAGNSMNKRLTESIVQGGTPVVFRGMDNIHMYAFDKTGDFATRATPAQVYNDMGSILDNELQAGTNAKVYYDIAIPTGVDYFLFYGEANRENGTLDVDNGALEATYLASTSDAVSKLAFNLKSIDADGDATNSGKIVSALNTLAGTTGWSTSTDFKKFYVAFTDLKAGSAASVMAALDMLSEGVEGVTPTTESDLQTNLLSAISTAKSSIGDDNTYPRNIGLPDGAAQIAWDDDANEFEEVTNSNIGSMTFTALSDYVYPAALYYWTASDIKTSDETQSDKYSTNWETCLGLYSGGGTSVAATTRSVALVSPINYAVGRFDVKAKFSAGTVKDNVSEDFVVTESDGIKLVGLLVGGQKGVQYDFSTPVANATEKTIYDQSIDAETVDATDATAIKHTLVLETEENTEKYFALELENNTGKSFVGHDGTVPAGGRFYLVGKLTPKAREEAGDQAALPAKVFIQDYITTANVTISSLAHAYNCIPDLSTPKLELGLSVDLEWEEGLTYDVTID